LHGGIGAKPSADLFANIYPAMTGAVSGRVGSAGIPEGGRMRLNLRADERGQRSARRARKGRAKRGPLPTGLPRIATIVGIEDKACPRGAPIARALPART
jgi:hypothetical protein